LIESVAEGMPENATIALLGWSLGGGVSIAAAARLAGSDGPAARRLRCVIAEAPYRLALTPARNVMGGTGVPTALVLRVAFAALGMMFGVGVSWRGFDRARHAAKLRCGLLVVHGTLDEICPVADGREIASAAPGGRLIEIGAGGHHSLWTHPDLSQWTVAATSDVIATIR
jgi:pimeloyl-ACP methyl ester carboxylesterase